MPDLLPEDVAEFTQGRLDEDDPRTAALLAVALSAARRYCGWHVTPVLDEVVLLDGPGSPLLVLPTLRLTAVTALTEDVADLDVDTDIVWSAHGLVRKKSGGCWSGQFGAISATISHGFAQAPDWQAAVMSMVDRVSDSFSTSTDGVGVGPFQFPGAAATAAGSTFTEAERSILDLYALEKSP